MRLRLLIPVVLVGCLLSVVGTAAAGNGTTVHHFTATYPDNLASCSGNRLEKAGANGFVKDVETCTTVIDVGLGSGTFSAVDVGWCSDYNAVIFVSPCNLAIAGHVTISDNGDGTFTWDIVAYYAHP